MTITPLDEEDGAGFFASSAVFPRWAGAGLGLVLLFVFLGQAVEQLQRGKAAKADGGVEVVQRGKRIALEHRLEDVRLGQLRHGIAGLFRLGGEHLLALYDVFLALFLFQPGAYLGLGLAGLDDVEPVARGAVGGLRGHDFHEVARLQRTGQGHDAAVDLGPDAAVAHGGVDAVGEVQRRSPARQGNDVALGGEDEHFVGKEVELQKFAKVRGIARLALPVEDAAEPAQLGVQFVDLLALFVSPVGGDAVFGGTVHLEGADLHLEGRP